MGKRFWLASLILSAMAICLNGCNVADSDSATDTDSDTDSDTDTDADSDADFEFTGVDFLIVIDNSGSMIEEQAILATGLSSLFDSFGDSLMENTRVAVVSTDMGLQYGGGETDDSPSNIPGCSDVGDDGTFQSVEMDGSIIDSELLASMSEIGTTGCGIEQQLEAGKHALERDDQEVDGFIKEDHVLAVLFITDEEDCSIKDSGLFATEEWCSGAVIDASVPSTTTGHLNTACNLPASNELDYLYAPESYYDELIGLKGGNTTAVVVGSIVGVPIDDGCEGNGNELVGCLESDDMQMQEYIYTYPYSTTQYYHFAPACERTEGEDIVTLARPGRRFVKLAQKFGSNGYISSICNADWSPAMTDIAAIIAEKM